MILNGRSRSVQICGMILLFFITVLLYDLCFQVKALQAVVREQDH